MTLRAEPEPAGAAPVAPTRDPFLPAVLLVILLAVALRLTLLFSAHATEEDFYITLRYAENIAHGLGFVYNPGAHVLGTTTPFYTLILALLARLRFDPVVGGQVLGIAADALACGCVYRLGRAIGHPAAGLAAALCLAVAPTNLIWATKGMEVGLVALAGVVAWTAWAERREALAWAAAAVLVLLRIDGAALAVVLLAATLLWERRVPWRGLLLFGALLLPWLLFATWYFGSPVPTSLRAKLVVYAWHASSRFPNLLPFLRLMTHNPLGAFLAVGAACFLVLAVGASRLPAERRAAFFRSEGLLLAPAVWIGLHYAGMALSRVFLFGWYFVPPTPIYYLVALTGWSRVGALGVGRFGATRRTLPQPSPSKGEGDFVGVGRWGRSAVRIALGTVVAGGVLSAAIVPRVAQTLRDSQRVEETLRIPIGQWLQAQAAPTDTVMLEPIGYIGYYSGLRVLDTVGLVSPEALPFYTPQMVSPYHALWTRFQPEWVLLRAGEWTDLQRYERNLPTTERLRARYQLVRTWPATTAEARGPAAFYLFRRK